MRATPSPSRGRCPTSSRPARRTPRGSRSSIRKPSVTPTDPEIAALCRDAAKRLEKLGCIVEERDHLFDDPVEIWASEFYTGVGTKLKASLDTRRNEIDPGVAKELDKALARDVHSYYAKVFERFAFRETVRELFDTYDVIASPTLPATGVSVGRDQPQGLEHRSPVDWVFYTYPFNLTGHPSVSVNAGFTQAGHPTGLQLVARPLAEETLFTVSAAFQDADPDKDRKPPMV